MGAVHGVYLKYVALSALSYAGYTALLTPEERDVAFAQGTRALSVGGSVDDSLPLWKLASAAVLGYSCLLNGGIALLFRLERGMGLIGKDRKTGQIPAWSYILLFPFHLPTMLYTYLHTRHGTAKIKDPKTDKVLRKEPVPVASEVQPGWWVGGCYGHELKKDSWGGIIDLTVEFPEPCINETSLYLSLPTWDGVPATPNQLEEAAIFGNEARKKGDVMVHCAHGRGRSTTVMCACLVKSGKFKTWREAFEKGIQPQRPVCKLNTKMQKALTEWQAKYVDVDVKKAK